MTTVESSCRRVVMRRSERGHAVSVLVLVVVPAIVLIAGLVIDGGQQGQAASRAESVAAGAARAAGNSGVTTEFVQGSARSLGAGPARQAAQDYLDSVDGGRLEITGQVTVEGHRVVVHTEARAQTLFLSLIGIDTVKGSGSAEAEVVAVR